MMPDYRSMYSREYVGHWDLFDDAGKPRDVTVTIDRVVAGELSNAASGGKKEKKPIVYFRGSDKGLALNKTNGAIIAAMYGSRVEKWAGKQITLYPTTTTFGRQTVECIRVRPTVPAAKKGDTKATLASSTDAAPAFDPSTGEVDPDEVPS